MWGRGLLRVPLTARQDGAGPGLLSAGQSSRLPGGSKSGAGGGGLQRRGACRGEGGGPGLLEPEAWAQVGKKFLGMNFIMRQQLPRVPTVGGRGGGVCVPVWGVPTQPASGGWAAPPTGPRAAWNAGLGAVTTCRVDLGPGDTGLSGTARLVPPAFCNVGVEGALPVC